MKKILVIEDNEKNMYLLTYILNHAGHETTKAYNAEDGIKILQTQEFDLICLDIQLPGISGLDAVREIRKLKAGKNVPIVAITSFAMLGDKERFLAGGFDGYIEKPIEPELITKQLNKFLTLD